MARGAVSSQAGSAWRASSPASALAQAQDVRDHARAFLGEGLGGQADGAQEIRLLREMRPQAGVLLVERVVAGHQGQHAARLQRIEGLGQKEVMQGEAHPVVVEPEIGERHIADDGVDSVLGQAGVAEVLDPDVVAGVQHAGDPSGEAVEFHADETHARRGQGDEVADPTAGLQHGRLGGHAQVPERRVHGLDDHRRGVEGGEGGTPGAGVVLGRQKVLQLLPELLPAGIFVPTGDRVREDAQGHRAEAGEAQRARRARRGWRAAGPARWPGACGSPPEGRGPSLSRRWWRGVEKSPAAAPRRCGGARLVRSTLLLYDVSGMVEKVMVRLRDRCTVIRASGCWSHLLARSGCGRPG